MIHFTNDGIYADSEEERLAFYDRMCAGDPVMLAHLEIWGMERDLCEGESGDKAIEG